MPRHQPDLVNCLKLPGRNIGLVCPKCDGTCPGCDSVVNAKLPARVCDDCAYDTCILCGSKAKPLTQSYYCRECVVLERDRDGCPRVLNVASHASHQQIPNAQNKSIEWGKYM
ncbi:U2 snRNP complex subunit [Martiniozyma asiatica (nom. inval.)]|nr:U2 snRNP complex subunit [Martiniozyma asiatica]